MSNQITITFTCARCHCNSIFQYHFSRMSSSGLSHSLLLLMGRHGLHSLQMFSRFPCRQRYQNWFLILQTIISPQLYFRPNLPPGQMTPANLFLRLDMNFKQRRNDFYVAQHVKSHPEYRNSISGLKSKNRI